MFIFSILLNNNYLSVSIIELEAAKTPFSIEVHSNIKCQLITKITFRFSKTKLINTVSKDNKLLFTHRDRLTAVLGGRPYFRAKSEHGTNSLLQEINKTCRAET